MNEPQMAHRLRRFAYLTVLALSVGHPAAAAPAASAKSAGPSPGNAAASGGNAESSAPHNSGGTPANHAEGQAPAAVDQDVAARSRMHECGHQWSAIKKAGNAGSRTWKEFSATCLVVR